MTLRVFTGHFKCKSNPKETEPQVNKFHLISGFFSTSANKTFSPVKADTRETQFTERRALT